jgi:hypothetical protein
MRMSRCSNVCQLYPVMAQKYVDNTLTFEENLPVQMQTGSHSSPTLPSEPFPWPQIPVNEGIPHAGGDGARLGFIQLEDTLNH